VNKASQLPLLTVKTIEISPLDHPQSLKGSSSSPSSSRLTLYPHAATSHLLEQQLFEIFCNRNIQARTKRRGAAIRFAILGDTLPTCPLVQ
jgi:hypothetical protein